jgi:lipoprotein-releasing system permease protein
MMLPFKIAVRFLTSNKGQTALIALGIAVGVAVQIFIGSLIQGLQKSLIDKTIGNSPHITITSNTDDEFINKYEKTVNKLITSINGVTNVSVSVENPALIKKDDKSYSVLIRGMEIEKSDKIYNIKSKIYQGRMPKRNFEVLIGRELRSELGADIGDEIGVLTNTGQVIEFRITGFYDLNVASLNKTWMITSLETAQRAFSLEGKVTSIEMQVSEVFIADEIADKIASSIGRDFKVDNWKAQNAELLSGLNGQSVSSIMIQVFVLIAVILGIASVLAISVVQKSKQIGILKAMGIKDSTASLIFLFQGLLLGIIGSILGVALGILLSLVFTKFALNPDGKPVVDLYITNKFIGFSALIALASAVLAALIPARRSSQLNPIEVIKNG